MKIRILICSVLLTAGLAACGSTSGNSSTAEAPANPAAPVTGTLRTFTYSDTNAPHLLNPF